LKGIEAENGILKLLESKLLEEMARLHEELVRAAKDAVGSRYAVLCPESSFQNHYEKID
jgi:hypothetical protein